MGIDSLFTIQLAKPCATAESAEKIHRIYPDTFLIETCQRWLWIGCLAEHTTIDFSFLNELSARFFIGEQAYSQILEITCGLQSELLGETEVFGQFKEAWTKTQAQGGSVFESLSAWIPKVFEDTKEVRTHFLRDIGSVSYGSVVRRILLELGLSDRPILLLGAGQIAQSVAPWIANIAPLIVWNRGSEKLEILKNSLNEKNLKNVKYLCGEHVEPQAWQKAQQVVVCMPFDALRDAQRVQWWQTAAHPGSVIHLGGFLKDAGVWTGLPNESFIALDPLFEKMRRFDESRNRAALAARKACADKAKLRSLGGMMAHGWEDLAAFSEVV